MPQSIFQFFDAFSDILQKQWQCTTTLLSYTLQDVSYIEFYEKLKENRALLITRSHNE